MLSKAPPNALQDSPRLPKALQGSTRILELSKTCTALRCSPDSSSFPALRTVFHCPNALKCSARLPKALETC
eukprot:2181898-Alexandrium_andersonii.AAC.1